jgi:hypothetical protein
MPQIKKQTPVQYAREYMLEGLINGKLKHIYKNISLYQNQILGDNGVKTLNDQLLARVLLQNNHVQTYNTDRAVVVTILNCLQHIGLLEHIDLAKDFEGALKRGHFITPLTIIEHLSPWKNSEKIHGSIKKLVDLGILVHGDHGLQSYPEYKNFMQQYEIEVEQYMKQPKTRSNGNFDARKMINKVYFVVPYKLVEYVASLEYTKDQMIKLGKTKISFQQLLSTDPVYQKFLNGYISEQVPVSVNIADYPRPKSRPKAVDKKYPAQIPRSIKPFKYDLLPIQRESTTMLDFAEIGLHFLYDGTQGKMRDVVGALKSTPKKKHKYISELLQKPATDENMDALLRGLE